MYLGSLWCNKRIGALLLPFLGQNNRKKGAVLNVATGLPEYIQDIDLTCASVDHSAPLSTSALQISIDCSVKTLALRKWKLA